MYIVLGFFEVVLLWVGLVLICIGSFIEYIIFPDLRGKKISYIGLICVIIGTILWVGTIMRAIIVFLWY